MNEDHKKLMIIIAGCAGHGKDTLAAELIELFGMWTSVRTDAYASTLKSVARESLCIPLDILMATKDIKESTLVDSWTDESITVRTALQDIGEWFRNRFGARIWANSVRRRAQLSSEQVIIVTDGRHPEEEIHWMKESCSEFATVITVRIRRDSVPIIRGHPSEDLISDEPDSSFDFIIENNHDLQWLQEAAGELVVVSELIHKGQRKKLTLSRLKGNGCLQFQGAPMLGFDDYQKFTRTVAIYPGNCEGTAEARTYCMLGLCGESGELSEKFKKIIRGGGFQALTNLSDDKIKEIKKELGDVLWYVARSADELGISLQDVADANVEKLSSRKSRNVLHGDGDNR